MKSMASIKKRGGSYLVTVSAGYDGQGKKIAKNKTIKRPAGMTDKKWEKEIQKLALEFEIEVEKGLFLDATTTLSDYAERWFNEYGNQNLQPKTLESYRSELDSKILPALGHIRLKKLTPVYILGFLNNLLEDGVRKDGKPGGYSNRTIKYQLQILSSLLQQAVYWQIMPENPCRRVKAPKKMNDINHEFSNDKIKFFDGAQTISLLEHIKMEPLKYQVAVNIAIFCGLRKGELLGLTWNDIDFKNNTLSVNKSKSYLIGQELLTKAPKNANSIRTVSMPDMLVKLLRNYKLWQYGEKATCGDIWDKDWVNTPWILTQWNGKGMAYNILTQWLCRMIKRHNVTIEHDDSIPADEKEKYILPVLSFHKLRHTSATLLIGENTDIRTVSARLGHAQTSTTMNTYVHGLKTSDKKAANALENLLNKDTRYETRNFKNA